MTGFSFYERTVPHVINSYFSGDDLANSCFTEVYIIKKKITQLTNRLQMNWKATLKLTMSSSSSSSSTTTTTTIITSLDIPVLCVFKTPLDCCMPSVLYFDKVPSYRCHCLFIWLHILSTKPLFHDYDVIYIEFVVDGCRRYQVMCWLLFYFHSLYMPISEQQFLFSSLTTVFSLSISRPNVTPHHSIDVISNASILLRWIKFLRELYSEDLNGRKHTEDSTQKISHRR